MVRASVLDLGSNSFHVLVADVDDEGFVTPVLREREMLHLGAVVEKHGGALPYDAIEQATETVAHLTELARRAGTEEHLAVATSALRDASNGPDVVDRLSEAAGAPVRVLSGLDEARLSYRGVRASVAVADEPILVLDLGGGSLEFAVGTGTEVTWAASTDLGVSRLSAAVDRDPPKRKEIAALRERIQTEVAPLLPIIREHAPAEVVTVGGTVRALARVLATDAHDWLPTTLNQYRMRTTHVDAWADQLLSCDLDTRLAIDGMKSRRADRIHLAALVVSEVLDMLAVEQVTVSDWGLREGVLLEALGVEHVPDAATLRSAAVERLRRAFVSEDRHLPHVSHLAGQVFDATPHLHGLDAHARDLLVHAATVHDVGEALALRRHHKHGAYIVEHAELRGFSPRETAVIASLVRFHKSRGTSKGYAPYAALSDDGRATVDRLLPLLQIADGLDRARDQAITGVRATQVGDHLTLHLEGTGLTAAQAEVERKLDLFERTFSVTVGVAES